MLELAIYALIGVILGAITSIIPGIHINTIVAVLLGAFYKYGPDPLPLSFLILGMAIAHAFVGFIPSIFLGAPSEDTVLSVAPGHRMLRKGRGYEALVLTISGGLAGIAFLAILFPILMIIIPSAYKALRPIIQYILLISVVFLVVKEKRKLWAIFVFVLAGAFGIIAMDSGVNKDFVLLPVLSGLFGISTLCISFFTESSIPRQSRKARINITKIIPHSLRGLLGGLIAGLLPGIGSSQSAIIASEFTRLKSPKGFMVMLGAIAATDILLSILALYLIDNPRSGAAVAIGIMLSEEPGIKLAITFIGAGIFAAGISAFIALKLGVKFRELVSRIDYKKIIIEALFVVLSVVAYFTGIQGILIAITGAFIGAIPNFAGVKKSLLLGCLILPTMLYFFGISMF